MTTLDAIVLGLVQGLTEFLPVSSTAHLLIAQNELGIVKSDLHVEVAAHLGTIVSVLLYYRRELTGVVRESIAGGPGRKLAGLVVAATLPLALVAVIYKLFPIVKEWRKDVHVAAFGLMAVGVFLIATRFARRRPGDGQGTWLDAVLMGLAQCAAAVLPGCSRSGSTIGTGLFRGLEPSWTARFSFLMSIPAILGGAVFELKDEPFHAGEDLGGLAIAAVVAFASGLLAIHVLLRVVGRGRLGWFGVYCIALGLFVHFVI